jgi:hypothetical protein
MRLERRLFIPLALATSDERNVTATGVRDYALRMSADVLSLPQVLRTLINRGCPAEAPSLDHVVELADQLAERTLTAIENGELTNEEVWNSPDVALILEVAQLVRSGTEFLPAMRRLAAKATEPTQAECAVARPPPARKAP